MSDLRFELLTSWLQKQFNTPINIKLISGDASFRSYFRVTHDNQHYIAVDSPIEFVPIIPFIELTTSYKKQKLLVPSVLASENTLGFMLLSDLGDDHLGSLLNSDNIAHYYSEALSLLPQVALVKGTIKHPLPTFNKTFINLELNIFKEWFIERHLNYSLSNYEHQLLDEVYDFLANEIQEQPQCTMHRDFHSRNIMFKDNNLHLIDYQDSVNGPITYDAVSLLRDCYVTCPDQHFITLQQQHFQQIQQAGLVNNQTRFAQYQHWFDLTGLQRHIKIAGIFSRLFHRDGKPGYLKDIPQTLKYITQVSEQYSELMKFDSWMKNTIIPLYKLRSVGKH